MRTPLPRTAFTTPMLIDGDWNLHSRSEVFCSFMARYIAETSPVDAAPDVAAERRQPGERYQLSTCTGVRFVGYFWLGSAFTTQY